MKGFIEKHIQFCILIVICITCIIITAIIFNPIWSAISLGIMILSIAGAVALVNYFHSEK